MTGIVTRNFRHFLADQIFENFTEADQAILYFFIAKNTAWPDENIPPVPGDTVREAQYDYWRNMIAAKKVEQTGISYVTRRINWQNGTVYTQYHDQSDAIWSNSSFVLTDNYDVYKCLSNNNGVPSTVKPTGHSTDAITTSDGYLWKFMYAVSASKAVAFLTINWMPVQTLTVDDGTDQWDVQQAAVNGGIEVAHVTVGGTGYKGGNGAVVDSNTSSIDLQPQSASGGGLVNSAVYIASGAAAGQLKTITSWDATLNRATVNSPWSPAPANGDIYVLGPRVVIQGDGTGAVGISTVTSNVVTRVLMINKGSLYTMANIVFISNGGASAAAHPNVSPKGGHGKDAVRELAGHNVMINVRLSGDEANTFSVNNDFRTIGFISNPLLANGSFANGITYDQTTKLILTGISGDFAKDELITGSTSGATGYVVEWIPTSNTVRLVDVSGVFQNTETISGGTSSATATLAQNQANGALLHYSGYAVYLENRTLVTRDINQSEDIKATIRL